MLYHIIVFDYNTVALIIVMLLMVISVKSMVVHVVRDVMAKFSELRTPLFKGQILVSQPVPWMESPLYTYIYNI